MKRSLMVSWQMRWDLAKLFRLLPCWHIWLVKKVWEYVAIALKNLIILTMCRCLPFNHYLALYHLRVFFVFLSGNWGPHLIIVPTSVMLNWEMELKRWCPGFKILTYYGSQKERKLKRQVSFDIYSLASKLHYSIFFFI